MTVKKQRVKDEETRVEEIQGAARKVFFRKGYLASSIEAIAKKAGISKGTVYLYFQNKEDLFISLVIPTLKELYKRLEKFENEVDEKKFKNGKEILKNMLDVLFGLYRNDPDGIRVVQAFQHGEHSSRMSNKTLEKVNNETRKSFGCVRRIISKSKSMSFFSEELDENVFSDILYAMFLGVVQLEETKARATNKDHLYGTLSYAYSLISKAVCRDAKND